MKNNIAVLCTKTDTSLQTSDQMFFPVLIYVKKKSFTNLHLLLLTISIIGHQWIQAMFSDMILALIRR